LPSYKTHDMAALIAAPIIIGVSTQITTLPNALAIGAAFMLSNRYLSPDLDIDSIMNKRWGILRVIWIPYKKVFHHRSFWTHSGPISATVRFIYLSLWLSPFLVIFPPSLYVLLTIYIGMVLADTLHTTLDKLL
jgi:uncharacterized metal-binding protein